MDQLNAHLDRGWDLVSRGDTRGALTSAQRALDLDPNSPEAYNLLGYISAAEGESNDALDHYRQAMALDEGYLDPLLNAAEVLVYPLARYDEAIRMCDEALDFAEDKEEIADALLLKFDALLGKGDTTEAEKCIDAVPDGPYEKANHHFLIGRGRLELGQLDRAEPELRRALDIDPTLGDAHYYLGLAAEDRGNREAALDSFLKVRELDSRAPRVPWSPPAEHFSRAVERAIAALSETLRAKIASARVVVCDLPAPELVADFVDPRIPLLLDGVQADDAEPGQPQVARLFVYQRNVERSCAGIEALDDELLATLTREIETAFAPAPAPNGDVS